MLSILRFSIYSLNSDKNPVIINNVVNQNQLFGAGIAGLITGKYFYDGPNFNENVDLSAKNIVITGGNTGLGKETAVKLATLGAKVTILCKTPSRAMTAVEEIKKRSKNNNVDFVEIDLASLNSVFKCTSELKKRLDKIDVLVNNAGIADHSRLVSFLFRHF